MDTSFQFQEKKLLPSSPREYLSLHHEPENAGYTPWETGKKKKKV